MATAAQTRANRANSRKSTGPVSADGKARSAQNARTHGLTGSRPVILPGQEQAFSDLAASLRAELAPCGAIEEILFQSLLHAAWTMHRCRQAEADLYTRSEDPTLDPLLDPACTTRLRLLDTYLRRAERAFHKAHKELRGLQATRPQPRPEPRRAVTNEAKPTPAPTPQPAPYDAESILARVYRDLPGPQPPPTAPAPRKPFL